MARYPQWFDFINKNQANTNSTRSSNTDNNMDLFKHKKSDLSWPLLVST